LKPPNEKHKFEVVLACKANQKRISLIIKQVYYAGFLMSNKKPPMFLDMNFSKK